MSLMGHTPGGHEFMNFMKFLKSMKSVPDRTNRVVHTPGDHKFMNFMKFMKWVSMLGGYEFMNSWNSWNGCPCSEVMNLWIHEIKEMDVHGRGSLNYEFQRTQIKTQALSILWYLKSNFKGTTSGIFNGITCVHPPSPHEIKCGTSSDDDDCLVDLVSRFR